MKLKNLKKPITINQVSWCYVEGRKVTIVHEARDDDGTYHRTIQVKIPLRIIKSWFVNSAQSLSVIGVLTI